MPELKVKSSEILEGSIRRSMDHHSNCVIKLVSLKEDQAQADSLQVVDANDQPLFKGVIQARQGEHAFGEYALVIHAASSTVLLDTKARKHTYQNITRRDIIKLIVKDYGGEVNFYKTGAKLEQIVSPIQYQESDWDFMKRIAWEAGCRVWPEHTGIKPKLYIDGASAGLNRSVNIVFREHVIVKEDDFTKENLASAGVVPTLYQAARASYMDYPIPAGWTKLEETVDGAGYSVLVLRRGNNIIIAYRGTDDIADGIYDTAGTMNKVRRDVNFPIVKSYYKAKEYVLRKTIPEAYGQNELAVKTLQEVLKKYPKENIYLTGHSLGGHLAQEAMNAAIDMGTAHRIKRVELFNALGSHEADRLKKNQNEYKGKVFHRKIQGDVVASILQKGGEEITYPHIGKETHGIGNFHNFFSFKPETRYYQKETVNIFGTLWMPDGKQTGFGLLGEVLEVNGSYIKVKFPEDRNEVTVANAYEIKIISNYYSPDGGKGVFMPPDVGSKIMFHFPKANMDGGVFRGIKHKKD